MMKRHCLMLVGVAVAALNLSSCAALLRYKCNREFAAKKGMDDAANARTAMPGRLEGNSCDGDYSSADFSKDYNFGFQQKKAEICAPASAASWGRADGEGGQAVRPQKGKLGMCEDRRLENIYEAEFKKAFCAPARATKLGAERAQAWEPADFETAFHDCAPSKALKNAYANAYRDAQANLCTIDNAKKSAEAEASARRAPDGVRGRFQSCAKATELVTAFDETFKSRKAALEKEDIERAAAAAAAARQARVSEFLRTTATSQFPFQLRAYTARCAVAGDRSAVTVEVDNPYAEQVLVQGNWKMLYYTNDFAKITEDRTQEAVLITGNNRKSFQKMTLPRDAAFCRAEFLGQALN